MAGHDFLQLLESWKPDTAVVLTFTKLVVLLVKICHVKRKKSVQISRLVIRSLIKF